jgi:hypothetical protein
VAFLPAVATPLQMRWLPAQFFQNWSEIEGRVRVSDLPNPQRRFGLVKHSDLIPERQRAVDDDPHGRMGVRAPDAQYSPRSGQLSAAETEQFFREAALRFAPSLVRPDPFWQ